MFSTKVIKAFGAMTLALGITTVAPAITQSAAAEPDAQSSAAQTTTVRYGPITLDAASADHQPSETSNQTLTDVQKPCEDCHITGFEPNLVYEDGTNANVDTGPMLHHMVMSDTTATDVTCGVWPGQRFFAAGNERVGNTLPSGYGMRVDRGDQWNILYDLMNHAHEQKTVYLSVTYTHESATSLTDVTPIWMDADGPCGDSAWDAPAGVSERSWQWDSTIAGDVVAMGGHLHHGGTNVWTDNLTTGQRLCESVAEEGGTAEFVDHHGHTYISDMSTCTADPLGTISTGDTLEITARYDLAEPHAGVMGIMMGWVAER